MSKRSFQIAFILSLIFVSCFNNKKSRIVILFDRVDKIEVGSPVKVKGVTIGEVTSLKLFEEGVLVSIVFTRKRDIPQDSKFSIDPSFLGPASVVIEPGQQKQFFTRKDTAVGLYNKEEADILDSALKEKIKTDVKNLIEDFREAFKTAKDSSK